MNKKRGLFRTVVRRMVAASLVLIMTITLIPIGALAAELYHGNSLVQEGDSVTHYTSDTSNQYVGEPSDQYSDEPSGQYVGEPLDDEADFKPDSLSADVEDTKAQEVEILMMSDSLDLITITFMYRDTIFNTRDIERDEALNDWPEPPIASNLNFSGWYSSEGVQIGEGHIFDDDMILYSRFTATVTFMVDNAPYHVLSVYVYDAEGTLITSGEMPADPFKASFIFLGWSSFQHGVFNYVAHRIAGHTTLTAILVIDAPPVGRYDHLWLAGPGGSIRNARCPVSGCGWESGNQYPINGVTVKLYYYPPPSGTGTTERLALVVITCPRCGTVSEWISTANAGALTAPGATPTGVNNMNMAGATFVILTQITFRPGAHGMLNARPGDVVIPNVEQDGAWQDSWVPMVLPNPGFTHVGWQDQHGVLYPVSGGFPSSVPGGLILTAMYSNQPTVEIIANSESRQFSGLPLTNPGFTARNLPTGYEIRGVEIVGSVTEVSEGDIPNRVILTSITHHK